MTHAVIDKRNPSVLRLLGKIGLALVAAAIVTWLSAGRFAAWQAENARHEWQARFGGLADAIERHPSRDANEAALLVERRAAALGVVLTPRDDEAMRPGLDAARVDAFRAAEKPLFDWARAELGRPGGAVGAPPAAASAFLLEREAELGALRDALANGDLPRWPLRLELRYQAPIPNLLGHLQVQKLLIADALYQLHRGDPEAAARDLEASFTLNAGLLDDPILITQLVSIAIHRKQLGLLRRMPPPVDAFVERVTEHDFRASMHEALQLEGLLWSDDSFIAAELAAREASGLSEPIVDRVVDVLGEPYERICLAALSRSWRADLERLEQSGPSCGDESRRFRFEEPPRWNLIARIAVPNMGDAVERVSRIELDREITLRWLRVVAARATDGAWPAALPGPTESAACRGARFTYETRAGGARLALDRAPGWPRQPGLVLPVRVQSGDAPPGGI